MKLAISRGFTTSSRYVVHFALWAALKLRFSSKSRNVFFMYLTSLVYVKKKLIRYSSQLLKELSGQVLKIKKTTHIKDICDFEIDGLASINGTGVAFGSHCLKSLNPLSIGASDTN